VSLAQCILDIHRGYGDDFYKNHKFNDEMKNQFSSRNSLNVPEYQGIVDLLEGKSLDDLDNMNTSERKTRNR
jgi:hypothetical protein